MTVLKLVKDYIKGTEPKAFVQDKTILLCNATHVVSTVCKLQSTKIYINTKALKHLYDKKPAEEFDFIIHNIHRIAKYPDFIYINNESKRGNFLFLKEIRKSKYLCSIEVVENMGNFIATCFRLRNEGYLRKYELMWSWKDGIPSS